METRDRLNSCGGLIAASLLLLATEIGAEPVTWVNGHSYELVAVPGGITWSAAQEACVQAGGYLATMKNAGENAFVFSLASANPTLWQTVNNQTTGPWLGARQYPDPNTGYQEPAAGWRWVFSADFFEGTALSAHWEDGQPDNSNPSENEDALCFFAQGAVPDSTWGDFPRNTLLAGYILEKGQALCFTPMFGVALADGVGENVNDIVWADFEPAIPPAPTFIDYSVTAYDPLFPGVSPSHTWGLGTYSFDFLPETPSDTTGADIPVAPRPVAVAAGDVDGDGRLDVIQLSRDIDGGAPTNGQPKVLFATSVGMVFNPVMFPQQPVTQGQNLATADLNEDSKADLIYTGRVTSTSGHLAVLYNLTQSGTATFYRLNVPINPRSLDVADFDEDGHVDVLVGSSAGGILIYPGVGNGTLGAPITVTTERTIDVRPADMNGDGHVDLLSGEATAGSTHANVIRIHLGNGDGTFQPATIDIEPAVCDPAPTCPEPVRLVSEVAPADFDLDGFMDFAVVANDPVGKYSVYLQRSGSFLREHDYLTPDSPFMHAVSFQAVLINDDAYPDLAYVDHVFAKLYYMPNGTASSKAMATPRLAGPCPGVAYRMEPVWAWYYPTENRLTFCFRDEECGSSIPPPITPGFVTNWLFDLIRIDDDGDNVPDLTLGDACTATVIGDAKKRVDITLDAATAAALASLNTSNLRLLLLPGAFTYFEVQREFATSPITATDGFWIPYGPTSDTEPPPLVSRLHPARPNPFNPSTTLVYEVGAEANATHPLPVKLTVHDVAGRLVATLVETQRDPGRYSTTWDGHDTRGASVSSGVYLARLQVGAQTARTGRLVVVR